MSQVQKTIHIVGAGLAGSECAWQLAERGFKVELIEMRGVQSTAAHKTTNFAELVCSNSLGSQTDYSAPGQLKWEAEKLNSFILKAAKESAIPAGMALGVDREIFAKNITLALSQHPHITIQRKVIHSLEDLPRPAVIATGPLTPESLALSIRDHLSYGEESPLDFLYFFDAIAPIVDVDTINMDVCYKADRFDRGTNDYINCPLDEGQYQRFVAAILQARKIESKDFEKTPYFQGCMPIEAIAESGQETLRFGPMSPKGLRDPRTGKRPHAVVQLRQENRDATSYNLVGFQTKMAYADQKKVFRLIPGLEQAEFLKLGSMHRNLYIHSPKKLSPFLSSRRDPSLYFAGQITGVEGYFESTCIGLMVARFLADQLSDRKIILPPRESAFGSLLNAITEQKEDFQPTNINFGLFPPIRDVFTPKSKNDRELKRELQIKRAQESILKFTQAVAQLRQVITN